MKIKIIAIPDGSPPSWVRQKWVGLILPVDQNVDTSSTIGIDGSPPKNQNGYAVDLNQALTILYQKDAEAEKWFRRNLPVNTSHLVFGKGFCEVVK